MTLQTQFRQAVIDNDTTTLDKLWSLPNRPAAALIHTTTDKKKSTPLHVAVSLGHLAATVWLVNHGAKELAQDSEGATPLSIAGSRHLHHIVSFFNYNAKLKSLPYIAAFMQQLRKFHKDTTHFQATNSLMRTTLKLSEDDQLSFAGRLVKKITLIGSVLCMRETDILKWESAVVLVKFVDGATCAYEYQQIPIIQELFKYIVIANGYVERAHLNQQSRERLDWMTDTTRDVYKRDATCRQFYDNAGTYVAERVYTSIRSLTHKNVQLFSFGCGRGKELIVSEKLLSEKGYSCKGVGFDLNTANFPKYEGNIQFCKGDMHRPYDLIKDYLEPESSKVGLFVGSLVNQCLRGTEEAVCILQQLAMLDVIILTGFTPVLVNKGMAKAMGWHVSVENITSTMDGISRHRIVASPEGDRNIQDIREVYTLTKMSPEKRKEFLIKRSSTKPRASNLVMMLDLSMSSNPYRDVLLFSPEELQCVKILDLRWTHLDIESMHKLFTHFQSPITLLATGNESWLKAAPANAKIATREQINPYEVPALTTKELSVLK